MYKYRKFTQDESRDITAVSAKHPQFCNCSFCIAAQIYMKYQVNNGLELSELDSHGRPIWSNRRKRRKFEEDKTFDPNGPFFRLLDRRSEELEKERQDLEQEDTLQSIQDLFDGTDTQPSICHEEIVLDICHNTVQTNGCCEKTGDGNLYIDNAMDGILGVYCNRI